MMARALGLCASLLSGCSEKVVFEVDDPWVTDTDWPGIGAGKVLVTNSGDDSLSFLDPVTLEPVYRTATGRVPAEREGPHHGATSLDGSDFFVGISNYVPGAGSGPHGAHGTGTVDGYLVRYDAASGERTGEVRVDKSPGDVRLTPDGKYVLQSHFDLQSILNAAQNGEDPRKLKAPLAVIDAETMDRVAMVPLCPAAHGMGLAPDGAAAYVVCWGSDELAVVPLDDPMTDEAPVERFPVGPGGGDPTSPRYGPYAATVSPDGREVWVSNLEGASLSVYEVETGAFNESRFLLLNGAPLFATFSRSGDRLYVPVQAQDALLTIDPTTGAVLHTLDFSAEECTAPHGTLVLEDGDTLGLVCEGNRTDPGTVVRIDLGAEGGPAISDFYQVGVYPDDLIYIPAAP